jgi:hypothetical protein
MKTIGIAVPCYVHHLQHLKRMLDSIEKNTKKPDVVIISCSSMNDMATPIDTSKYSFPVQIIYHTERLNAAQNRNIAAAKLETDIISFFDADDIMHSQRIEAICGAFENYDCILVLHNFLRSYSDIFQKYETIEYQYNVLSCAPINCAIVNNNYNIPVHHSQVSISKDIFNKYKINEANDHERREDSVYCATILRNHPTRNVYIPHPLSAYESAGYWIQ